MIRYFKFHLIYKRKFLKTPGIPCLCSNLYHPYHESKFEQATCEVLSNFFRPKDILVPTNHKYNIKFDFIINNVAIIEPHGIWSGNSSQNTYYDYYKQRKMYADQNKDLKPLPLVVLTNISDLSYLKKCMNSSKNYKKTFFDVSVTLLDKYKLDILERQPELFVRFVNIWLIGLLIFSLILNFYLFSVIYK